MSSPISLVTRRRRSPLLACSFPVAAACVSASAASVHQVSPNQLPPIEVVWPDDQNLTRASVVGDGEAGTCHVGQAASQAATQGGDAYPLPGRSYLLKGGAMF